MVRYNRDSQASEHGKPDTPKLKDRTAVNARHDSQNKRYDPEATEYKGTHRGRSDRAWIVNKTLYKYTDNRDPTKIKTSNRKGLQ